MNGLCEKCTSPTGCAGASACMETIRSAIEEAKANRMEIIQNGTCAYMSPRPYGLWINWHIVAKIVAALDFNACTQWETCINPAECATKGPCGDVHPKECSE